jgi:hypothetical protein
LRQTRHGRHHVLIELVQTSERRSLRGGRGD